MQRAALFHNSFGYERTDNYNYRTVHNIKRADDYEMK